MLDLAALKRSNLAMQLLAGPISLRRKWHHIQDRVPREILDRIAINVRQDLLIQVDEHNGEFAISPRSDLTRRILRDGFFEPEIAEIFYRHIDPERDVIDIGANVGFFTVGAAKRLTTGRVLSVEPTAGAFDRLSRNITHNNVADKVILFNGLLSDVEGNFELNSIVGMEEYSSMGNLTHPSIAELESVKYRVLAARLDELVNRHNLTPALIKIDVEGAEHLVFAGAVETLKQHRPFVISELSDPLLRNLGGSAVGVVKFFENLNYRVFDLKDQKAKPGQRPFSDIICIPAEAA